MTQQIIERCARCYGDVRGECIRVGRCIFAGSIGRNAILIELNPECAALAERRLTDDAGMFAEVKAA